MTNQKLKKKKMHYHRKHLQNKKPKTLWQISPRIAQNHSLFCLKALQKSWKRCHFMRLSQKPRLPKNLWKTRFYKTNQLQFNQKKTFLWIVRHKINGYRNGLKIWGNLNCLMVIGCRHPSIRRVTFMDFKFQNCRRVWYCRKNIWVRINSVLLWVLVLLCVILLWGFLEGLLLLRLATVKENLVRLVISKLIIGYLCTQTLICKKRLLFVKLSAIFTKRIRKQNIFWSIIFQ